MVIINAQKGDCPPDAAGSKILRFFCILYMAMAIGSLWLMTTGQHPRIAWALLSLCSFLPLLAFSVSGLAGSWRRRA